MFAIVELLRAVAAFMVAPIFVHLAATTGGSLDAGTGIALWIGLGLADRRRRHRRRRSTPSAARARRRPTSRRFLAGVSPGVGLAAAAGKRSLEATVAAPSTPATESVD